jgi:signal transduction histidine kinase
VTNAVKHAGATRVAVSISVDGDADGDVLVVEVRDDGVGGARVDGAGSGLLGLADRVGALGGRLVLHSPPGHGTTVRAEVPVRPGVTAAQR